MTDKPNNNPKLIRHEKDICFTIVAQLGNEGCHVDYQIFDMLGHDPELLWSGKDREIVDKLEDAELWAHGYVKWDGCSNWWFDIAKDIALHGCEKEDLTRIGKVLGICWDWTKEICPSWDGD